MKKQIMALIFSIFCLSPTLANDITESTDQSFDDFWEQFRSAVIQEDLAAVTQLTQFPFQTRGSHGNQSIIRYDRSSFMTIFNKIIDQKVYTLDNQQLVPKTMKQVIKGVQDINDKHIIRDDLARVEQFTFIKTDEGAWLFERAYLSNLVEEENPKTQRLSKTTSELYQDLYNGIAKK